MTRISALVVRVPVPRAVWTLTNRHFVASQNTDGGWAYRRRGEKSYGSTTAFCLLFLAKGNRPVLIQKLQHSADWNRNINDFEHLTAFIGETLGKRTTWQSASLDLSLEQLRQSPILFIAGHKFPTFTDAQKAKLQAYVDRAGGTLLLEACCGSDDFKAGFRKLAAQLWPDYPLAALRGDHPVFSSVYDLDTTYDLQAVQIGCRMGAFFSPRALSCLWELQDIPVHSELAFQLGTNIAAYATGRDQLRDRAKVDVVARSRHIRPTDNSLYEYPIVFMQGHSGFECDDDDIAAMRRYLQRGGVLLADACCGRKPFDTAFRQMATQLFPDESLTILPADHPIDRGETGIDLGELRCRPAMAKRITARGTSRPPLESVTIDGRTVILYSQYDWSCSLEGDHPYSCVGYADADGKRLALAMFLYLINY